MKDTSIPLIALALIGFLMPTTTANSQTVQTAPRWQEVELVFTAERGTANHYTDTLAYGAGNSGVSPDP